ncbi:MAG: YegS/Rv2252/BmrU family lipid kinase [Candidatus Eremiobacteraeota bacterium]|nr:YegS/Rv2252/BmrU family lipid kinase [Candidatus Eremiobacteraeota bacterium]
MRSLLILNEKSRRGAQLAETVRASLRARGAALTEDRISPGKIDSVIAAGGDGTVISAVDAAMSSNVPLGIIPLGTFNDLARSFDLPPGVEESCNVATGSRTRLIDVGRVNGRYFVNEASIGLSTRIARRQTPEVKRRFGFLGIAGTTLQTLRQSRPFHAEVHYDGKTEFLRTIQITIANNAHFGGVIDNPDAAIDDNRLDLYSIEVRNWLGVFPILRKLLSHDPRQVSGLRMRGSARFVVRTSHAHHVSADGEPAGFTPATFEVLPRALRVLIP